MNRYQELIILVHQIEDLIENNRNSDGSLHLDAVRCRMALEFAKIEIEKSISLCKKQTD